MDAMTSIGDARRVDARARKVGDARARWVTMTMASTCDG